MQSIYHLYIYIYIYIDIYIAEAAMYTVLTFGVLLLLGLVAVQADDEATLLTHPVDVEQGGLAGITHLPHAPHRTLPRQLDCNTFRPAVSTTHTLCP